MGKREKNQLSITLTDRALAEIDARAGDETAGYRSGWIDTLIRRYADLMRASIPDLSVGEWRLIADALNGANMDVYVADMDAEQTSWARSQLIANVSDSIGLNRSDKRFGVDGKKLIKKITDLSPAQQMAVLDTVGQFWASHDALLPCDDGYSDWRIARDLAHQYDRPQSTVLDLVTAHGHRIAARVLAQARKDEITDHEALAQIAREYVASEKKKLDG